MTGFSRLSGFLRAGRRTGFIFKPLLAMCGSFATAFACGQLLGSPPCASEVIRPNLILQKNTDVVGVVCDPSGEAYPKPYRVELRDQQSESVLYRIPLREEGNFRMDGVPAGNYRLLIVNGATNVASRPPLMDQPANLQCGEAPVCQLEIMLKTHGTDQLYEYCPPR